MTAPRSRWVGLLRDTVPRQFLSQNPTQRVFETVFGRLGKCSESIIDERLIAAAPSLVNLLPEPVQNFIVNSNGDPRLARRGTKNRAPAAAPEVVLSLHRASSYCRRSRGVAFLAETRRGRSPRHV